MSSREEDNDNDDDLSLLSPAAVMMYRHGTFRPRRHGTIGEELPEGDAHLGGSINRFGISTNTTNTVRQFSVSSSSNNINNGGDGGTAVGWNPAAATQQVRWTDLLSSPSPPGPTSPFGVHTPTTAAAAGTSSSHHRRPWFFSTGQQQQQQRRDGGDGVDLSSPTPTPRSGQSLRRQSYFALAQELARSRRHRLHQLTPVKRGSDALGGEGRRETGTTGTGTHDVSAAAAVAAEAESATTLTEDGGQLDRGAQPAPTEVATDPVPAVGGASLPSLTTATTQHDEPPSKRAKMGEDEKELDLESLQDKKEPAAPSAVGAKTPSSDAGTHTESIDLCDSDEEEEEEEDGGMNTESNNNSTWPDYTAIAAAAASTPATAVLDAMAEATAAATAAAAVATAEAASAATSEAASAATATAVTFATGTTASNMCTTNRSDGNKPKAVATMPSFNLGALFRNAPAERERKMTRNDGHNQLTGLGGSVSNSGDIAGLIIDLFGEEEKDGGNEGTVPDATNGTYQEETVSNNKEDHEHGTGFGGGDASRDETTIGNINADVDGLVIESTAEKTRGEHEDLEEVVQEAIKEDGPPPRNVVARVEFVSTELTEPSLKDSDSSKIDPPTAPEDVDREALLTPANPPGISVKVLSSVPNVYLTIEAIELPIKEPPTLSCQRDHDDAFLSIPDGPGGRENGNDEEVETNTPNAAEDNYDWGCSLASPNTNLMMKPFEVLQEQPLGLDFCAFRNGVSNFASDDNEANDRNLLTTIPTMMPVAANPTGALKGPEESDVRAPVTEGLDDDDDDDDVGDDIDQKISISEELITKGGASESVCAEPSDSIFKGQEGTEIAAELTSTKDLFEESIPTSVGACPMPHMQDKKEKGTEEFERTDGQNAENPDTKVVEVSTDNIGDGYDLSYERIETPSDDYEVSCERFDDNENDIGMNEDNEEDVSISNALEVCEMDDGDCDGTEQGLIEVSVPKLCLVLLPLFGLAGVFWKLGLVHVSTSILVGCCRTFGQLSLLGTVLAPIFKWGVKRPSVVFLYALFMVVLASYEASSRTKYSFDGQWWYIFGSLLLNVGWVGLLAFGVVLKPRPLWKPQYVLPIIGMLLGNSINGIIISLDAITTALVEDQAEIELYLSFGASKYEAVSRIFSHAIQKGATPVLTMLRTVGIVSLPGMMTGQILGGSSTTVAARYQMLILFLIALCTLSTILLNSIVAIETAFCSRQMLRPERFVKNQKLSVKGLIIWLLSTSLGGSNRLVIDSSATGNSHQGSMASPMVSSPSGFEINVLEITEVGFSVPLLEVSGLGRYFLVKKHDGSDSNTLDKNHLRVLFQDLSFDANEGHLVMVSGPSGSGKTQLLRILAGLIPAQEGQVKVTGRDWNDENLSPAVWRKHVRYVTQYKVQIPGTPLQFISKVSSFESWKNDDRAAFVGEMVRLTTSYVQEWGLSDDCLDKEWSTLSGGEAQRVLVAIALASKPTILLCDEVVSALDRATKVLVEESVKNYVDRLEGIVLWTSH